ncbi:hypothetical protein [Nitratidesulfovibrio termitidis]|uniref:hypothetical protein n=1 Tax=Nitratidesulfovibrio termitidis TaxID=42252 RepID=UPI0005502C4B|nr:hypothetical protein [Nitratidesulfovibrio termitidis]
MEDTSLYCDILTVLKPYYKRTPPSGTWRSLLSLHPAPAVLARTIIALEDEGHLEKSDLEGNDFDDPVHNWRFNESTLGITAKGIDFLIQHCPHQATYTVQILNAAQRTNRTKKG